MCHGYVFSEYKHEQVRHGKEQKLYGCLVVTNLFNTSGAKCVGISQVCQVMRTWPAIARTYKCTHYCARTQIPLIVEANVCQAIESSCGSPKHPEQSQQVVCSLHLTHLCMMENCSLYHSKMVLLQRCRGNLAKYSDVNIRCCMVKWWNSSGTKRDFPWSTTSW